MGLLLILCLVLTLAVNHVVHLCLGGRRPIHRMAVASTVVGPLIACALWLAGRLLGHRDIDLTSSTPWLLLILPAVVLSCALQHVYSTGKRY